MQKSKMLAMLLFAILTTGIAAGQEQKAGKISGKIMIKDGGALADGIVMFYDVNAGPPPSMTEYFRVPQSATLINNDGSFEMELREGQYYIGAVKKAGQGFMGPPKRGDLFFISEEVDGKPKLYSVKSGGITDIGTISGAMPFKGLVLKEGATAVEGTALYSEGKPVEGTHVLAFATEDMAGVPLFVSDWTGKDGKYILGLHEGGKYYLRIPPLPNTSSDVKVKPLAVTVKTGEILKGIDIKDSAGSKAPAGKEPKGE